MFSISLSVATFELLCCAVCAALLWQRRNEAAGDLRRVLAACCAFFGAVSLMHCIAELSGCTDMQIFHTIGQTAIALFFVAVTAYELAKWQRVPVTGETEDKDTTDDVAADDKTTTAAGSDDKATEAVATDDKTADEARRESEQLWERITHVIEVDGLWRTPDVNLVTLSHAVYSNRTYVAQCFKDHSPISFNEYINRKRISYVADQLRENPEKNLKSLFEEVGYPIYSTGFRQFCRIIGCSPTDYVARCGR